MLAEEYLKLVKKKRKAKKPQMKWGELWERYASRYTKPEEQVAIAISHYLNTKHPDLLWWHCPNEGEKRFWQQTLSRLLGVKAGVPDIQIPKPCIDDDASDYAGCVVMKYYGFFCEIKAGKNKLSPAQKDVMARLNALGYYTCTVYSLNEFIKEWEAYCG